MTDLETLEDLGIQLRDLRDDQTTVPCPADGPCICADFDHVLDGIEVIALKLIDGELKYLETVRLPELEDPEDADDRKGVVKMIEKLYEKKELYQP